MKYIITSGAMEVKIDDVRTIKNSSTGLLASTIANLASDKNYDVTYIHTPTAKIPNGNVNCIKIETHEQLLMTLKAEICDNCIVIHTMAVSDFIVKGTIDEHDLFDKILKNKFNDINDVKVMFEDSIVKQNKISSKNNQLVVLEKHIKIIDEIKKINENTILVGFKLMSNVSEEQLLSVGLNMLRKSKCDYVVANLKQNITASKHQAYIINEDIQIAVNSKDEIAKTIIKLTENI